VKEENHSAINWSALIDKREQETRFFRLAKFWLVRVFVHSCRRRVNKALGKADAKKIIDQDVDLFLD